MTLPKIPLSPLFGEIGQMDDWTTHSLFERIGTSDDGETKLFQTLNRGRFEMQHSSGLWMRIELGPMLDDAAEALRLEAESRKGEAA